jgi:hypothetical protein
LRQHKFRSGLQISDRWPLLLFSCTESADGCDIISSAPSHFTVQVGLVGEPLICLQTKVRQTSDVDVWMLWALCVSLLSVAVTLAVVDSANDFGNAHGCS